MKKLLLSLFITLSTTILAKTPDSLFGVYINDNVLDYFTKEEIKSKYRDKVRGFYTLRLNNPPVSNKDYSDELFVKFDKNNKIAKIKSQKRFKDLETCKNVEYVVRKTLESKYDFEFERNPMSTYGFQKWVGNNVIATECFFSNNKTLLLIFFQTEEYTYKHIEDFYSKI